MDAIFWGNENCNYSGENHAGYVDKHGSGSVFQCIKGSCENVGKAFQWDRKGEEKEDCGRGGDGAAFKISSTKNEIDDFF